MPAVTQEQLDNAALDCETLGAVVNGAADLNGNGTTTNRTGTPLKTLLKQQASYDAIIAAQVVQQQTATAAATLAGLYANANTDADIAGAAAGERGSKYWSGLSNRYANANTDADIAGAAAGERGSKWWNTKAQEAKTAAEAASASAVSGADIAAGVRFQDELGTRNLFVPELQALLPGSTNGATGAYTATGGFTTVRVRVNEGVQYFVKYVTLSNGSAGVCYRNAALTRVGGSNSLASNLFTPPSGAVWMDVTFDGNSTSQRAKTQEVYRGLTVVPTKAYSGRVLDDHGVSGRAAKMVRAHQRVNRDFFIREDHTPGFLVSNGTGTLSYNSSFATSNLIPLVEGEVRVPSFDAVGNLNVAFYDRDKNYLYSSGGGGTLTCTTGSNQVTISTFTASSVPLLRLIPGQPMTVTGYFPAGTIVVSGPADGGAGPYTLSSLATAGDGVTPVAFTAQGCTKDVPWSKPRDAEFTTFPVPTVSVPWAQITSKVRAPGDIFVGSRMETFGPVAQGGVVSILGGNSIMQSSAAGINQPSGFIPGMAATVGVTQYMLQVLTQMDVQQARGSSGIKTREILNALAGYAALAQTDVQALSVTATTTIDNATLVVTAGTLYVGRRIEGRNIRPGTYIVADLGGGSYTMSQTAYGSTAGVTVLALPVRRFYDESGTNSWGLVNTVGADAQAQIALGTVGDTWTPSQFNITCLAGSKVITINSTALGAAAEGMPIVDDEAKLGVGNSLRYNGSAWELTNNAAAGGTVTARGGSFAGDLYDVHVRKLMSWEPTLLPCLIGLIRRFDGTADLGFTAGAFYREGDPRNNQLVYLSQFNDMKKAFAARYNLPFFDAFNKVSFNSKNYTTYFTDKLHPNTRGCYEEYVPAVAGWINKDLPRIVRFV